MDARGRLVFLALLLLLPIPPDLRARTGDPPPPALPVAPGIQRERVNLILIDVVVTDKKGHLVSDLRPQDFTLRLDGHPYPIDSVELRWAGEGTVPAPPSPAAPAPAPGQERASGAVPSFILPSPRRFAFLLDGLNSEHGLEERPIQAVRSFLQNNLLPGDEVMVTGLGRKLKTYQEFTSDRALMLKALDAAEADEGLRRGGENRAEDNMRLLQEEEDKCGGCSFSAKQEAAQRLAATFAHEDRSRALRTLASLRAVIASLGAGTGPKELIFLTDGFPMDPDALYGYAGDPRTKGYASMGSPSSDGSVAADRQVSPFGTMNVGAEILRIAREASAAQVAIDTVNTQGIPQQLSMSLRGVSGRSPGEIIESSASEALAGFALGTGGIASRGSNDFLPALQRVESEAEATYVVAFKPPGDPDGQYHATRVEVLRKGVRIRANEGFLYLTESQQRERQLLAAYMAPEMFHDFPVALETISYLAHGEKPALEFAITVPDQMLLFLNQQGAFTARLEAGVALRAGKSQIADSFSRSVEVRLTPQEMGAGTALSLVTRREVAPGDYDAVAVVRDLGTGNIGALEVPVKVPDLAPDRMAMSSVVLTSPGTEGRRVDLEPATSGDSDLVTPAPFRIFPRGAQLQASCLIYHPQRRKDTGEAEFQVRGEILKGGVTQKQFPPSEQVFTPQQEVGAIPLRIPISLAEIEPGIYTLQVQVADKVANHGIVQRVDFVVK